MGERREIKKRREGREVGGRVGGGGGGYNCPLISNYSRAATRVTSLDLYNINTPTEDINRVQP